VLLAAPEDLDRIGFDETTQPVRWDDYQESSNAGCLGNAQSRFRITHPFHPLCGAEYELVTRKLTWGEDRVFYYDPSGELKSFLTNVTDLIPEDAFSQVSSGRSAFRLDDLLELRRLIDRTRAAMSELNKV